MKCIILIAAPAAGKGTISKYIEDKYNYKHISTCDLLRKEIKNDEVSLDDKINHYATVKMADNGKGLMVKGA